jgi:hypothetical protein
MSSGSRESNKDQTGDNGQPGRPDHDLDSSDAVAVEGGRVHVSIANGGQGFYAEETEIDLPSYSINLADILLSRRLICKLISDSAPIPMRALCVGIFSTLETP